MFEMEKGRREEGDLEVNDSNISDEFGLEDTSGF